MKIQILSYSLSENTPAYGGGVSLQLTHEKQMSCGDSCNQITFTMSNHLGTHIDAPRHFSTNGATIDSFPGDFWVCNKVGFLDYKAGNAELIHLENLKMQMDSDIECLILKTGFCHKRGNQEYWQQNPGLATESAEFLRAQFPKLRIIGFDFISLSSYQHREEGRKSHRAFLAPEAGSPILIVEDMDLRNLTSAPKKVTIAPLRLEDGDGAPVTVFAEI